MRIWFRVDGDYDGRWRLVGEVETEPQTRGLVARAFTEGARAVRVYRCQSA